MIGVSTYQDVASRPVETGASANSPVGTAFLDMRSFIAFTTLPEFFRPVLEVDSSSVRPRFEIGSETYSLDQGVPDLEIPEEILEVDIVVKMPPRKRYSLPGVILSWKKGEPPLVHSDRSEP